MTDLELLAELIDDLFKDLRPELVSLTPDELGWNPAPQANSIGVTLWHMARGLDLLAVPVLGNKLSEDELWHTMGWREKTGYDPRGVGYVGWGVLTGFTWEDVQQIPVLTAEEKLSYLEHSCRSASALARQLNPEIAHQPAPGLIGG